MVASCRQYPATPIFHVRIPDIRYSLHEETALGESVYELERNSLSILLQTYNNPDQIGLLQTAFSYKTTLRAVKLSELTSLPTGAWVVGDERAVCAGLIALGRAFRRRVNGRLSKSSAVNGRVFRIVVIRFVGSDVRIREGWLGVGTEEAVWQGNVGTLGDVQWRRVQSIGVTRGISSVRADVDETRVRGERWGGEMRMLNERRVRDGRSRVVDRRERTERGSLGELDRRRSEGRSDVGGVREGDEQVRERDSGDRHEPVYLTARMAEFDFGETRRVSECESVVTRSAESEEESDDELEAVCRRHLGRGYREEVDRVLRRMN